MREDKENALPLFARKKPRAILKRERSGKGKTEQKGTETLTLTLSVTVKGSGAADRAVLILNLILFPFISRPAKGGAGDEGLFRQIDRQTKCPARQRRGGVKKRTKRKTPGTKQRPGRNCGPGATLDLLTLYLTLAVRRSNYRSHQRTTHILLCCR